MSKKDVYTLTNPQKSIWNTELFFNDTIVNNICVSGTIYEDINIDLLKKAVNETVRQNDAFRTRIIMQNDIPMQYISDYKEFDIDVVTISNEQEVKLIEQEEVKYKFEMIDSDLYKFKLVKFANYATIILNAHHIIADSWSMGLVIQEIIKNYHKLIGISDFEETTSSYIDYINSEEEYKISKKLQKDKEYWEEIFSTIPETATIPTLKEVSKNTEYTAKRLSFNIDKKMVLNINEFCKDNNISAFNFFMSVFSIYISRVSNIDDFVIGTPILNRTNFKDKHTMGMFVNTVPVRVNTSKSEKFNEFTHSLNINMMNILRHQKYSYTSVLEDLRDKNKNVLNLYNIIISYQITKAVNEEYGRYSTNWTFNNYCANDFNIHISDINDTGDLIINYDYLDNKYSSEEIVEIHNRILNMINQVLLDNNIDLNNIEIVTEEEKNKILNVFNNTKVDYPKDKTIVDLFEEQVSKTPNNIAVVFENQKLTYKELNEKANSLANYLISLGIKQNTVIGLRLNKKLEMIIGILAIIKSGCCYLPINMQYPQDRVEFMLKDSNCKVLLGTEDSLEDIKINVNTINISLKNKSIYEKDNKNLNIQILPENIIYIIYTSGSTGTPKGAMICHRNVVRLFKNDNMLFKFNHNDVWTMFHSVAFDFSVWEMYGALLFGGKLVLVKDEIAQDPNLFLDLMRKEKVTVLNQTPTYFYKLLKTELQREDKNLNLRYIIFGGEALKPNLIQDWYKKYPNTELINMYGITETTVHVTYKKLTEEDMKLPSSNIGIPIPTLHVIIVDKNLNLLPFGVEGEMCVIGEGVFKGYLNREDLNSTKLVNKPEYSDKLIYKSGDTAIMHKDGHLEYIGRIDTQIKIRGFRVELGEIEEKILKYANIDTCIVTKKVDENEREFLCAYYIKNGPINISNLRIILNNHLPSYMIPQYFIEIERVPININGKTDLKALPMPNKTHISLNIIKPRNDIDQKLIEIYQDLLHINNVSISDSFFELGGDSLTAISICENINQKLDINLNVKDILDKDIIMNLSDYISNNKNKAQIREILIEKRESYPLSYAQKRVYYASKMIGEDNLVYNVPGAILINKILDKNKVEKCFKKIIENQSAFRTYFVVEEDDVKQKIQESVKFNVKSFENKASKIKEIIKAFPKPFDLESAPLLRVELHYLDNEKTLLLLDSHHIIMDGSSLQILINDFYKLYNEESIDNLEIEYKDYAVWENDFIESEEIKEAENYWVNKFKDSDIPSINLPYDYSMPAVRTYNGDKITKKINKKDFDKYLKYAKELNVSPYMLFMSAFFVLLYKYTGQEEIILGSPTAGRDSYKLKNIIGMFVNNLVVDAKIKSENKFTEFLNEIKAQVVQDLMYQNYPYDLLVKKLNLPTDNTRNPLFDVMFAYQNTGDKKLTIAGEEAEFINAQGNIAKFNLSFEIDPSTRVASLEYRTDLFKKETIERLFEHYINTLEKIVENKDIHIKDISIISETEKDIILNKFNDTKTKYPKDKSILELFNEIVRKYPNDIAVTVKNDKLTYKELDEKSNFLANELSKLGIRHSDVVGVCLNKSLELLVSIWAIIKTGAIYMPIYTEYPKDRIEYMLENSEAKLLISNSKIIKNIEFSGTKKIINSVRDINKDKKLIKYQNTSGDSVLYIIYTSGTTGKPKGVQITNKNLINYIFAFKKYFENDITNKDSFLSSTNISFDVSIFELFVSILCGANLVLYEEEVIKDIVKYCNSIINNGITMLYIPPNILNEVYSILKDNENIKINKMLVGVEAITKSTLNKYYKLNPNMKIINGYGPTETTICCTALKYKLDETNDDTISIGNPLYNNQIYILDKDKNIQPIGITGEIYVTGDGVGKGYINNIQENNKNYLNNIINNNSEKMYKTGDLAKWNIDGSINLLGRNDSQIKILGHRIELKGINNIIMQYPNITKAFTTINEINGHKYVVSYFIAESTIKIKDLESFLKVKLPNYMIPNFIYQLEEFPLTLNGKVDKNKLPMIEIKSKKEYIEPRDEFEKQIIKIWRKLFLIDKIGIDDDFFELGGDSLTAIKFQIESMNAGLNISYSDIFSYTTPRRLAERNNSEDKENYSIDKDYDYTLIDNLIAKNSIENLKNYNMDDKSHIGNLLLIGSTGFLGAHILDNYLSTQKGTIYCLIRKKSLLEPEERLKKTLNFYFDSKYDNEFGKRIKVINGDIVNEKFALTSEEYNNMGKNINIVINSGALVKHYGAFEQFNNVNILGTKNIIQFCKKFNKKLYHISTLSVSGNILSNDNKKNKLFKENQFFIKQKINNVYIYTKFEAEKIIYEEIMNGLDATVLRIGNITNRYIDGKFQINTSENAFVNRIKSILRLGVIQNKFLEHALEFTPVDICSDAILKIANSNPKFTIFHIYNNNFIRFDTLLANLNALDINLKPVSDEEFSKIINKFLEDENLRSEISGIVTDLNKNKLLVLVNNILPDSEFSQKYLELLGFKWPKIDMEYIEKYIKYFKNIKYIN